MRWWIWVLVVIAVLIIADVIFILMFYFRNRKYYKELAKQAEIKKEMKNLAKKSTNTSKSFDDIKLRIGKR